MNEEEQKILLDKKAVANELFEQMRKTKDEKDILKFVNAQTDEMNYRKEIQLKYYKYDGYKQFIQWDVSALRDISNILSKPKQEITIFADSFEYIKPIKTKNRLKDITEAIQKFYNQVIDDDKRSCFYIEGVIVEGNELNFQHGT